MEVNIHHAKTNLSKLIAAAESGEEVIIARNGKPAVKLVVATPHSTHASPRRRILGAGRGEMTAPSDEEWAAMDKEIEELFNNSKLFPDEAE